MATVEEIRATEQLASVASKLDAERKNSKALSDELNTLRNKVVKLEDKSVTEKLEAANSELTLKLAASEGHNESLSKQLAKSQRDLAAAAPALALVEALQSVKG